MAESLAALGVASNIVQFVELGFKIAKAVIETYRSTDIDGLAERNVDLIAMTFSLKERCTLLHIDAATKADPITMGLLMRCIKLADELLSELEGLKISTADRHRSLAKFVISVRAYWKKSKIEALAARIADIRKEIFRRLEPLLYDHRKSLSEAMRSLGEASAAWNNATERRLDAIAQDLGKLLNTEAMETPSDDLGNFANQLCRFADEANHRGNIRAILKSLQFAQIKERQSEIPQAHRDTFQWIYDDSSSVGFKQWFQHPSQGIFWVTGKPGSGKSTLMKLILGHKMTQTLGEAWAAPKPLIVVGHFFWSVGTKMQNSQEGLLRSLLFQIFIQCPEIIPETCMERYSNPFRSLESWSLDQLSQAFARIQQIQELPFRFLLLVDGLDEYSGEPREVISFLRIIAKSSSIKICCSSRPWPQFVDAFGQSYWKLEMQNLTKNDILRYAQDNLLQHARFREVQKEQLVESRRLIQTISDKSEGVFFWVSLVVKSLLRGLDNRDDVWVLHERLAALPSDLQKFFQRMLDSIEDVYLDYAFCAFTMLLTSKTSLPLYFFTSLNPWRWQKRLKNLHNSSISRRSERMANTLWGMSNQVERQLLNALEIDQLTASTTSRNERNDLTPDTHEELPVDPSRNSTESSSKTLTTDSLDQSRNSDVRDMVLAKCRDLVQSWTTKDNDVRMGFLHRSVFEFLLETPSLEHFLSQLECGPYSLFPLKCCFHMNKRYGLRKCTDDALLRLCHFMQELETDRFSNRISFWDMLWSARVNYFIQSPRTSELFPKIEDVQRLLGHAQARALLKFGFSASNEGMNSRHVEIVTELLRGSVRVDIRKDDPEVTWSDLIDLELLAEILNLYEEKFANARAMMNVIWQTFLARVTHLESTEPTPANIIQACKIFVEHEAPRYFRPLPAIVETFPHMRLPDDASRGHHYDAIHMLQSNETVNKIELDELGDLFPSERLAQRTFAGFSHILSWLSMKPAKGKA